MAMFADNPQAKYYSLKNRYGLLHALRQMYTKAHYLAVEALMVCH